MTNTDLMNDAIRRAVRAMVPQEPAFDFREVRNQDIGNVLELGHANLWIGCGEYNATAFYVGGLGLTRDPYLATGVEVMWINVGRSQIHLPGFGPPQIFRGTIGLVVPDLDFVRRSLEVAALHLRGTRFAVQDTGSYLWATCPFGNRFKVHQHEPQRFGRPVLGIPYIKCPVLPGAAAKIARFYRELLGARAIVKDSGEGRAAHIRMGPWQELIFTESGQDLPAYDGHHIMITLADFSGPYFKFEERGLITRHDSRWQWRFEDIIDLASGEVLFQLEHEIRSTHHPQFGRPLVNRNPSRNPAEFVAYGEDLPIDGPGI